MSRLRVVSNFGDCDCGAGKILPAPQSPSPKLETTRSLIYEQNRSEIDFSTCATARSIFVKSGS